MPLEQTPNFNPAARDRTTTQRNVGNRLLRGIASAFSPAAFQSFQRRDEIARQDQQAEEQALLEQQEAKRKEALDIIETARNATLKGDLTPEQGVAARDQVAQMLSPDDLAQFPNESFVLSENVRLERESDSASQALNKEKFEETKKKNAAVQKRFDINQAAKRIKESQTKRDKESKRKTSTLANSKETEAVANFLVSDQKFQQLDETEQSQFATITANEVKNMMANGATFEQAIRDSKRKFDPLILQKLDEENPADLTINNPQGSSRRRGTRKIETRQLNDGSLVQGFVDGNTFRITKRL